MNTKQSAFVEEYLRDFNATQAALRAGYSKRTAGSQAHDLLKKPEIQQKISERITSKAMSADETLLRLAEHARGNLIPFLVDNGQGSMEINLTTPEAKRNINLVKKYKVKRTREVRGRGESKEIWEHEWCEIELYDSQAALGLIGKHHRLFGDSIEEAARMLNVEGYAEVLKKVYGITDAGSTG